MHITKNFILMKKLQYRVYARLFKGAMKLYFTHYLCAVIILLNTILDRSAFSTYSFEKLVFRLSVISVFSARSLFRFYLHNIYVIIVYVSVRTRWFCFYLMKKSYHKNKIHILKNEQELSQKQISHYEKLIILLRDCS